MTKRRDMSWIGLAVVEGIGVFGLVAALVAAAGCGEDAARMAAADGPDGGPGEVEADAAAPDPDPDPSTATIATPFGAVEVPYDVVGGIAIWQTDVVLGVAADLADGEPPAPPASLRWPAMRIPYQLAADLPSASRAQVEDAIASYAARTPFVWEERRPDDADHVQFEPLAEGGCRSALGRRGGRQSIAIGPACGTADLLHAMGHTVGLLHQHQRADRDEVLAVELANIQPDRLPLVDTLPAGFADAYPFDFASIQLWAPEQPELAVDPERPIFRRIDGPEPATWTPASELADRDVSLAVRGYVGDVVWSVTSAATGLCLDVQAASLERHAPINVFPCHGGDNQLFAPGATADFQVARDRFLAGVGSGQCADIPSASGEPGVILQQFPCNGGPNQAIAVIGDAGAAALRLRHSGLCLQANASTHRVTQEICDGSAAQTWQLTEQ